MKSLSYSLHLISQWQCWVHIGKLTKRPFVRDSYFWYSYSAAPCELFFAHFKKADINPRKVPTTKKHFETVMKLVWQRCRSITRQQLILHFHHCWLEAYKYLIYERLWLKFDFLTRLLDGIIFRNRPRARSKIWNFEFYEELWSLTALFLFLNPFSFLWTPMRSVAPISDWCAQPFDF